MKTSRILLIAVVALCITACDEDAQFDKELYKKVIYALSEDDLTFSVYHDLNQEESTGFVSIGCGGTKHVDRDVMVEIELDNDAVAQYNKLHFDIDESKFAHSLASERFRIPDMTTELRKDNVDDYNTIPVYVRPEGLSPDSTYLIPLRIKSVSDYEVNPDKSTVLYRVLLKNDYAVQSPITTYKTTGLDIKYKENGTIDEARSFTVSRIAVPLTKNSIRCFVSMNSYDASKLTKDAIQKYAMSITVNKDATLTVASMGTTQIEMIDDGSNYYKETTSGLVKLQSFYVHYRYRFLKDGCDGSNGDADYDIWHDVEEIMTRKLSQISN